MTFERRLLCILFLIFLCSSVFGESSRRSRKLRFPKGASFLTAVALTSFLPKGITDGIVHVLEFDWGFPFPENFAFNRVDIQKKAFLPSPKKSYASKNVYVKKYRRERSLKDEQKRELLYKIEEAITRVGLNGTSCVARFQCELRQISPNSLLEELLVSLFRSPWHSGDSECSSGRFCPISVLHVILHSEQTLR